MLSHKSTVVQAGCTTQNVEYYNAAGLDASLHTLQKEFVGNLCTVIGSKVNEGYYVVTCIRANLGSLPYHYFHGI